MLVRALNEIGYKGQKMMNTMLHERINVEIHKVRQHLKKMAGPLATTTVPADGGWRTSKNIHIRVGDAIKVHKKGDEFTVHTGAKLADAKKGVIGQRKAKLAHIVAKGIDPFMYSKKLPQNIRSSSRWYKASGNAIDISTGLKMRQMHPGFYQTFDFIEAIRSGVVANFDKEALAMVKALTRAAGFVVSGGINVGQLPSRSRSMRTSDTSVGGKGK
jgi:hypothetical protein